MVRVPSSSSSSSSPPLSSLTNNDDLLLRLTRSNSFSSLVSFASWMTPFGTILLLSLFSIVSVMIAHWNVNQIYKNNSTTTTRFTSLSTSTYHPPSSPLQTTVQKTPTMMTMKTRYAEANANKRIQAQENNAYFPKRSDGLSLNQFSDDIIPKQRRNIPSTLLSSSSLRRNDSDSSINLLSSPPTKRLDDDFNVTELDPTIVVTRNGIQTPAIVWLMSFPNSGTSYTIQMTREVSNLTTATNYALEGDIRHVPSVPAITGKAGRNGPFLELTSKHNNVVPPMLLTKTHCTGYCSDCGPWKLLLETPRSFQRGCRSGFRAVLRTNTANSHSHNINRTELLQQLPTLESMEVMYDASLVHKAIHIFRHPLDNIVARFHLIRNERIAAAMASESGSHAYEKAVPKNAQGFQKWCRSSDAKDRKLLLSKYIDDDVKRRLVQIPCFNEFYKYVQWHNMAFYTTHDMGIETLLLHYHEYSEQFNATLFKVLNFLDLPVVGTPTKFHPGKMYRHYYTSQQRRDIYDFIREYATPDTWRQLREYDFEIDIEEADTE